METQIDCMSAQMLLMQLVGIFPSHRRVATNCWRRWCQRAYATLVLVILLQMAVWSSITLVQSIRTSVMGDITYALSQSISFCHMSFVAIYFQWNADACYDIANFANATFRRRSATGKSMRILKFRNHWRLPFQRFDLCVVRVNAETGEENVFSICDCGSGDSIAIYDRSNHVRGACVAHTMLVSVRSVGKWTY